MVPMSSEEDARDRVAAERQRIWAAMQTWTEAAYGLDDGQPVVVEGAKHRPLAPFFDELHAMVFADEDDDHAGAEYPYEDGDVIVLGLRAELDRLRAVVRELVAERDSLRRRCERLDERRHELHGILTTVEAERDGWKRTVTAMMGEEERLRAALDRLREQAEPIVADGNPDDDAYTEGNLAAWTYVHHVLEQPDEGQEVTDGNPDDDASDTENIEQLERLTLRLEHDNGRLRAVAEAARAVLAVIDSTRPGRLLAGLEGHDEVTLLRERLDRLDGSAEATDG